ncbi:MAG: hypothetical protein HGB31_03085 [Erysipelotrichaceae bacterium]|nr:hypothetical protein [Erysipelotrichaceae bacterium]
MRKIIILILSLWLMIGNQKMNVSALGSGTPLDPWQIFTVDDLKAIGTVGDWDDSYILMNNLDLSGKNWTALGTSGTHLFSGTFDGNEHDISGLTIDVLDVSSDFVSLGLFYGLGGATITDLSMSFVDISVIVTDPEFYIGALAGFAKVEEGGKLLIDHVTIKGTMDVSYRLDALVSRHRTVGGMIGEVIGDNDPTNPSLISNNTVALDMGVNFDLLYEDYYYFNGDMAIGGFVGHAEDTLFQSNIYESTDLAFTSEFVINDWDEIYVGGIVGLYTTETDYTSANRSIFLDNTTRNASVKGYVNVGGLIGKYISSINNHIYEAGLNEVLVQGFYYVGGIVGYGAHLTFENIRIKTLSMKSLQTNSSKFGGVIAYGTDIDFKGIINIDGFVFSESFDDDNAQTIGSLAGQLMESSSEAFITAKNVEINAYGVIGGLIGAVYTMSIDQATVSNANLVATSNVGGIVGVITYGTLTSLKNVTFDGEIHAESFVGGISGRLDSKTNIDHAIVLGDIYISEVLGGGLIGRSIYNYVDTDMLIVTESYVRANIHYTYNTKGVGGLIGGASSNWSLSSNPIKLTDVYFAGQILMIEDAENPNATNPEFIDPILGWDVNGGAHVFTYVYYDSTLYPGTNNKNIGVGKTTTEMMLKTAYEGFDFSGLDHWFIYSEFNDGYATFNPGLVRIDFTGTDGTLLGIVIIDPNSTVNPIDDPKLEGFVFDKWLDEEDNPFDFNTSLGESIVLKASFKEELPDTGVQSYWMWILGISLGLGLISRKKQDSK